MALRDTAEAGDRLATLRMLRNRLAKDIDVTGDAAEVATLSRQLIKVLEQIEGLEGREQKGDSVDDLAAARAARRAAAADSVPASGSDQRGAGSR
ncbi:hypothetical protein ACF07Q_28650 [Nocardiopsis dassonvillei]|uniref:hypothetical protein n=1 Tax=Nocardiopsis dassonvillei TaxID=2014 RepID=UPI0037021CAF